ncbi:MAG TPA: efflux RND transporter permease subunit, partial [Lacipirellulaceae bacterium]|nr:efflux RND transporter permease subunit [Lacipirellulaceae bacterium]
MVIRHVNRLLGRFFRGFNWFFERATHVYGIGVSWCLRLSAIVLLVYVGLIGLTGFGFSRIPMGFIPMQDKGYLVTNIQLPDSSSLERTIQATDKVEQIALETPGVAHTLSLPGMSYVLNANSSSYSNVFVILEPFHDRREHSLGSDAIADKIRQRLKSEVPEARVLVFGAPPISGLGTSAGFKLMVEGIGDVDLEALQARADELAAKGNEQPGLVGLFNGFRARTPQLYVDIDREKVKSMGVPLTEVFNTLQACVGSYYVNDFNRFGRTWQVNVQAEAPFRVDAEAIRQFKVRNFDGEMVPLGAVAEIRDS